jgi:hypothetical protein
MYPSRESSRFAGESPQQRLEDGTEAKSFHTLLASLSTIVRSACRRQGAEPEESSFTMMTRANAEQKRASALLGTITV